MSFKTHELNGSLKKEQATIIVGRHIILKLVERLEDKKVLEDSIVKAFLATPDLAHNVIQKQIRRLLKIDTNIEKLVLKSSYFDFLGALSETRIGYDDVLAGEDRLLTIPRKDFFRKMADDIEKIFESFTKIDRKNSAKLMKIMREDLPKKISEVTEKRIESLNEEVLLIEKSLKKKNEKIDIIKPIVVPRCPNCREPFLESGIIKRATNCRFCHKKVTPKIVDYLHLNRLSSRIRQLYQKNLWLEEYVAKLLRKISWENIWTHVYILGASGVRHEIDVLAIKGSRVCLAECKTGKITRADVFNFWTKVSDIRSHISLFASLEEMPDPETRQFLENNPSIFLLENMEELHEKELLKTLEGSMLSR